MNENEKKIFFLKHESIRQKILNNSIFFFKSLNKI